MRRIVVFLAALLVTTVAWAVDSTSYSLDVDVSPTHQPSNYLCKAIITDLSNGTVIFAPSIQLRAGAPANASIVEGDLLTAFKVSVDPESSRVTAEVTVTRAGKVISAQKSSVAVH